MPKRADPFRSLAENSPYFIGICDNEMVPFFVNAAGRRAVGIDPDEDVTKLLVKDFFFPEDQEFMFTEFFDRVMRDGMAEVEVRFRNFKSGAAIWMLYNVFPVFGEEGARVGFATVSRDITSEILAREALRASEQRFREVMNLAPQFIWVTCADGTLEYVNEQWSAYSGLDLEASADQARVAAMTHPDDRPLVERRWAEARASGEPLELEVRLRGHDGVYRWFLARTVPLRDAKGEVVRWVTASTDIHTQKEAARALEEIDHRKDEFLATLSHELRTPLTSGYGWVKLLGHSSEDKALRATGLAAIEQSFVAQIGLVDDLLDVSRIIAGKLQLDLRETDAARAVEAAVATVRPAAEQRGVRLESTIDHGVVVRGDEARLTQIVWNLLSNAIKFTPPQGVVEVCLARTANDAEIIVRDSGQGIDPGFLPFVFDRFRQADSSSNRRHGGLGLGLSIVSSLVEAHGGEVQAASAGPGLGATFTVTIPLIDRVEIRQPRYADRAAVEEVAIGNARVLVLDDDDASRTLMTTILERAGAEVRAFSTASDAISALTQWKPDVLVSDLSMPVDDGYSFVRHLRASGDDIPAIAVTAYLRTEDAARNAGFQDHLAKPFTPSDLIAKVRAVVAREHE
jgi:PAS domain S-box-containing protein